MSLRSLLKHLKYLCCPAKATGCSAPRYTEKNGSKVFTAAPINDSDRVPCTAKGVILVVRVFFIFMDFFTSSGQNNNINRKNAGRDGDNNI